MATPRLTPSQREELTEAGVQAIYLFGSRAQGLEMSSSDYDYAILMPTAGYHKGDPLYLKLYELLAAISPRALQNDVIDIVFLRDAGLELKFHVVHYGRILLDNNPLGRLDFENETTLAYCDYRPILDEVDHTILTSL